MKPTCICGNPISFGRSNVKRCSVCHSLQVRDWDGIWVFEYVPCTSGLGSSTLFIPRKERKANYKRTKAQANYDASCYEKARIGL